MSLHSPQSTAPMATLSTHSRDSSEGASQVQQPREAPLSIEEVQTKPWKYIGYKTFSSWVGSDNDFFVIRRFDCLNARVILSLQWELSELERKLKKIDDRLSARNSPSVNNGSFRWDDPERKNLIEDLYKKLKQYNKFVLNHSALKERPIASDHDVMNVKKWLGSYSGAIDADESEFINCRDDLTNVVSVSRTPLRTALEKFEAFRWNKFFQRVPERFKVKNDDLPYYEYDPEITRYHSDQRVEHFITVVVCFVGFVMLIAPLWILMYVQSNAKQLGIITGFIALFLALVQSVTIAKPFESLAATAAYSAVLMVFMQITPQKT